MGFLLPTSYRLPPRLQTLRAPGNTTGTAGRRSALVGLGLLFDGHILEFAGFEDFRAVETFDEFTIFVAGHDADARMLASLFHRGSLVGRGGAR